MDLEKRFEEFYRLEMEKLEMEERNTSVNTTCKAENEVYFRSYV